MLSSIRKFSTSIYAKILLGIVVIPFVFWGMGSAFKGGNKNIIVQIDNEKHSVQDFASYIQSFRTTDRKINSTDIDNFLTTYIGDKLIEKEYEYFGIKVSDKALSELIKNQKEFKRENIFSRTEYEKFLLSNSFTASNFESRLANQEKKKQLLDLIGGGISPPKFIVDINYNNINQKRKIELINLNDVFAKEVSFDENEVSIYFEKNKNNYKDVYKSISVVEITPIKLINNDDYTDLFFKKIDEIDNRIADGKNLNDIIKEFDLPNSDVFKINQLGKDVNNNTIDLLPKSIAKNIFSLDDSTSIVLLEIKNKFFIIEVIKTEEIQKNLKDQNVKKNVEKSLKVVKKRKFMSKIISQLNQNNFKKKDFDKLSVDKKVSIKKILINNRNDTKNIKDELVKQIYTSPEKKVIIINDISLVENYLIYIDEIENVSIADNPNEYENYAKLSEIKITNGLFNTYDALIKRKYKIDINYNALKTVKNYFN